jgi:hypothetical protein
MHRRHGDVGNVRRREVRRPSTWPRRYGCYRSRRMPAVYAAGALPSHAKPLLPHAITISRWQQLFAPISILTRSSLRRVMANSEWSTRGVTMPSLHIPDDQPHQPPLRLPECPWCLAPMRLACTMPHQWYTNLDLRLFECVCGTRVTDVAARPD